MAINIRKSQNGKSGVAEAGVQFLELTATSKLSQEHWQPCRESNRQLPISQSKRNRGGRRNLRFTDARVYLFSSW